MRLLHERMEKYDKRFEEWAARQQRLGSDVGELKQHLQDARDYSKGVGQTLNRMQRDFEALQYRVNTSLQDKAAAICVLLLAWTA